MLATIHSAMLFGVAGCPITVEVHENGGMPSFTVVGQPDTTCRESRDRVRAAILSSGFDWPQAKVTVNLAPSGMKKTGAGLDLAIAIGILVATEQLPEQVVENTAFIAELGLDGALRRVPGTLPMVASLGHSRVVVPQAALEEAALVDGPEIVGAMHLRHVCFGLLGEGDWKVPPVRLDRIVPPPLVDLAQVRGQQLGRRALEVSAAGGHHLLMSGPPGAGKTMMARALPGLLPLLDTPLALQVTSVHSAAGVALPQGGLVQLPPFRAPHHTSSSVSLVGGGTARMRPGEISCAHGGVLFLDEMAEFSAVTLDALRQPLEEGVVRVARAYGSVSYPAGFLLVGAMNPCPCGSVHGPRSCRCTDAAKMRYARRLSGPLLDRFDLRIHVHPPDPHVLFDDSSEESTADVAVRVMAVRHRAEQRGVQANAQLSAEAMDKHAPFSDDARTLLKRKVTEGNLSARGVKRIRAVALTIQDLEGQTGELQLRAVAEALALRSDPITLSPKPGSWRTAAASPGAGPVQ